jgi:hypothetical protein
MKVVVMARDSRNLGCREVIKKRNGRLAAPVVK